MTNELTREEHIARAMLLDLTYVANGHYYVTLTGKGNRLPFRRLDADTLEPINLDEAAERVRQAKGPL